MKKVVLLSIVVLVVLVVLIAKSLVPIIDYKFFVPLRDKQRVKDIQEISSAIASYFSYNHLYPGEDEIKFGQSWKTPDITYLKKVPTDPKKLPYQPYCYNNLGNMYLLCSQIEDLSYKCSTNYSSISEVGVCNTCKINNGLVLNYNYCNYGSY